MTVVSSCYETFNSITAINQAIILSNDSNTNPLWLDDDLIFVGYVLYYLQDWSYTMYIDMGASRHRGRLL
jgi:hypothetical protein